MHFDCELLLFVHLLPNVLDGTLQLNGERGICDNALTNQIWFIL